MNIRTARRSLWFASALAGASSVAVLLCAMLLPYDGTRPAPSTGTASRGASSRAEHPEATSLKLSDYEAVAAINLRRPLVDPAPLPVVPQPLAISMAAPPSLGTSLKGTVIEPGHSFAILSDPSGGSQLKGVGEMAGPARIVRVDPGVVTLDLGGQTVVLSQPADDEHPSQNGLP